jgi:hypothetical protein
VPLSANLKIRHVAKVPAKRYKKTLEASVGLVSIYYKQNGDMESEVDSFYSR